MEGFIKQNALPEISAIDLFCGAGGLTHGLIKSGIKVQIGVDIDPICKYPYTINNNVKFILKPVEELTGSELKSYLPEDGVSLLAGCAPCQTFSTYNHKAKQSDKRWWLLLQFSRLINEVQPNLVTMENVPGLIHQNVYHSFVTSLKRNGYYVKTIIIDCAHYGIPQHRNRLVLLASKYGEIVLLSPEEFGRKRSTVKDAIGALPYIGAGTSHPNDPLHQSSALSNLNLERIKSSIPGGTWKDWDKSLVAICHQKNSGKTYKSVYGRMQWEKPSPTITTQFLGFGNGRFGHPVQNRAISLREGAILQSFPPDYQFSSPSNPVIKTQVARLIGNAVPPKLGEVIGESILKHLSQYHVKPAIELRGA